MPYEEGQITPIEALKVLASLTRSEFDALITTALTLRTQIQTLEARYDANVTASTDADADYAAEVTDGRVDSWGNEQASLGKNIRSGQDRLDELLKITRKNLQAQINELAANRIEELLEEIGAHGRRKNELALETEARSESDTSLQTQVQSLSEASLRIMLMLSDIREVLRKK